MPGHAPVYDAPVPKPHFRRLSLSLFFTLAFLLGGSTACVDATEDRPALAADVAIDRMVLAQSTGVLLADGGELVLARDAPVVANRAAALRVVLNDAGATARDVRVVVEIIDDSDAITFSNETVVAVGDAEPVVVVDLPAEVVQPQSALAVSVVEVDGAALEGDTAGARLPAGNSFIELDARVVPPLEVVLVPLQVGGVGPSLDDETVDFYREALLGYFPTATVELSVHADPLERDAELLTVDDAADEVFLLGQRKLDDGAGDGVVYFGAYDGAVQLGLAGATDFSEELRAAVGPVDGSRQSAKLMAHEIGHLMGAAHTPSCNPGFTDPNFPDEGGRVGIETRDAITGEWLDASAPDLMGYCFSVGVSPYTTSRLFRGLLWWESP